jgi:hypothetical protein
MKTRLALFAVFVLIASHALAQTPAPRPPAPPRPPTAAPPAAPAAPPAAPAPAAVNAPAPPPAPPAPPAAGSRQPINIKVDVTISEEGGGATPVKKTVSTVAGDGFSGSVRETATVNTANPGGGGGFGPGFGSTALNVDASPVILPNGKLRVGFNFQYSAGQSAPASEGRPRTDIRQSLVLILESGKTLRVSEATDPLSDRHVTIEVTATILK